MIARVTLGVFFLIVTAQTPQASAAEISYEVTSLGGSEWQYSFDVTNNSLSAPIQEFTIFFDPAQFTDLAVGATQPLNWQLPIVVPADPALLPDLSGFGYFDTVAQDTGIARGASLGGFTVDVSFLGSGQPGGQDFEIVDPATFSTLEQGKTLAAEQGGGGVSVPEPSTIALFVLAAVVSLLARGVRRLRIHRAQGML
jgi:PEP-CTERM motif-containing protein